MIYKK